MPTGVTYEGGQYRARPTREIYQPQIPGGWGQPYPYSPLKTRPISGPVAGAGGPGGGGAGGVGAFGPVAGQTYGQDIQANPYLSEVFGMYKDLLGQAKNLYGEALDPTAALQSYQDLRAQGLKELQAQTGARGFAPGTGLSLAQSQDYLSRAQQGEQGLAADWRNRGLQFQAQVLGQMASALGGAGRTGADIAGNQLGLAGQGLDAMRFGLDAWYKQNMLPIELERARSQTLSAQIDALSRLGGLI